MPQPQAPSAAPPGYMTPGAIKAQQDYADALLKSSQGEVPGTKGGWTVGVQHLVNALIGGNQAYQANQAGIKSRLGDVAGLPGRTNAPDSTPSQGGAPSDKTSALP